MFSIRLSQPISAGHVTTPICTNSDNGMGHTSGNDDPHPGPTKHSRTGMTPPSSAQYVTVIFPIGKITSKTPDSFAGGNGEPPRNKKAQHIEMSGFFRIYGGEVGIRTLGRGYLQRFSRPPLSTAQPPLQRLGTDLFWWSGKTWRKNNENNHENPVPKLKFLRSITDLHAD